MDTAPWRGMSGSRTDDRDKECFVGHANFAIPSGHPTGDVGERLACLDSGKVGMEL